MIDDVLVGGRGELVRERAPVLVDERGVLLVGEHDVEAVGREPPHASLVGADLLLDRALDRRGKRADDVRRGVTTVGPHRDDVEIELAGMPSRTHASQGEQRTLALALRLAGHRLVAEELGRPPTLLLDDVFSELDPHRSAALLASLPPGQTVLSSAVGLPPGTDPELVLEVRDGQVTATEG